MSFTLLMSGVIVGRSELETRDSSRRVARGVFRAGLGYDLVQPIFALYDGAADDVNALARYRKARQALRLQLTDSSGAPIAVRDLHIRQDPAAKAGERGLVMEIETDDPAIWQDR
jgi:hypothetical protein